MIVCEGEVRSVVIGGGSESGRDQGGEEEGKGRWVGGLGLKEKEVEDVV